MGKKQTKNPPQNGSGPAPHDLGQKEGNWGRSTPENRQFGGFGAQQVPPAQFGQRNRDFGSESRPRRKTDSETGIWDHGRVPVAKQGWTEGCGAQNGFKPGDLRLIPRPRRTTRSETRIWGRTRDPGAKTGQKRGFGADRAPPAVNRLPKGETRGPGAESAQKWRFGVNHQLRNGDLGSIPRPPRGFGSRTGDLGVGASRGPAGTYSARSPFPASYFGGKFLLFKPFFGLFFFGANSSVLGRIEAVLALSLWGGERDNRQPLHPPNLLLHPLRFGAKSGENGSKAPPPPQAPRQGAD